jgi:hypothetical protein
MARFGTRLKTGANKRRGQTKLRLAPSFSPYLFSKQRFLDPQIAGYEFGGTGFKWILADELALSLFNKCGLAGAKSEPAKWLIGFAIHES